MSWHIARLWVPEANWDVKQAEVFPERCYNFFLRLSTQFNFIFLGPALARQYLTLHSSILITSVWFMEEGIA